jgi:hypothetical protein
MKFYKSKKLLNVDNNAKTVKGQKYKYLTGILYLAPFLERESFLNKLRREINALIKKAKRLNLKPAVRLNGTSDIDWNIHGLYNEFPKVKFYDYTKIYKRALKYVNGAYPKNYHLTYSLNEDNKQKASYILKRGGNISAVFRDKKLPKRFKNFKVIDGDKSDLKRQYRFCIRCLIQKGDTVIPFQS